MKKAVAICGKICSGKSSFIDYLSISYEWDIISFGKYISCLASDRKLSLTREVYQDLGQKVFQEKGPKQFLFDVIQFNQPASFVHLYDGIRHLSIIETLREIYQDILVIYLSTSDEQRYHRYISRGASHDSTLLSYKEFLTLSERPVEREVTAIGDIADHTINTNSLFSDAIIEFDKILVSKNFIIV